MTLKAIHGPSNFGCRGAEVHQWCTKLKIFGHLSLLWHRGSEQTQSCCLLPGRQQVLASRPKLRHFSLLNHASLQEETCLWLVSGGAFF
ncbi:hypothetical protein NC653_001853 [Populus alba x Populus x berolinensis]|uniref:Uncharacterized protein n=1 Tax=Populus alba x Populus x berolinensis TaxID=444605 RepID=A0AAD6RMC4_9ROSI|nr:hypothetical protein NC653_001853 [Populus alba x Populus x berolinensis]